MRRRCAWRPEQNGQTASFLRTALQKFPEQVKRLLAQVGSRADKALVRRFMREVSCSSWIEAYFILVLLAAGARPVWEAPLRAGFRTYPVLLRKQQAGDCLHPSLELLVEGVRILVLFQVSLQTSPTPIRVDGLVAVGLRGRKTRWLVVELDGPLHVPSRDGERQRMHDLPEVRLPEMLFGRADVLQAFASGIRQQLALPNPLPESLRVDWKERRLLETASPGSGPGVVAPG